MTTETSPRAAAALPNVTYVVDDKSRAPIAWTVNVLDEMVPATMVDLLDHAAEWEGELSTFHCAKCKASLPVGMSHMGGDHDYWLLGRY